MNKDDYADQEGMLENILAHESVRRDTGRQNNDAIRHAEAIRLSLKNIRLSLKNIYLSSNGRCSIKNVSLKYWQNSPENACVTATFLLQNRL